MADIGKPAQGAETVNEEDLVTLNSLQEIMQPIYETPADIHNYTRELGDFCRTFLKMDDKYRKSTRAGQTFAKVTAEIEALLLTPRIIQLIGAENVENVRWVINQIQRNQTAPGVTLSKETNLNIQDLLVRTWNLATDCDRPTINLKTETLDPKVPMETKAKILVTSRELVILNLLHNRLILANVRGGCLPGISTRLTQAYCGFFHFMLQKQYEEEQGIPEEHRLAAQIVAEVGNGAQPAAAAGRQGVAARPAAEERVDLRKFLREPAAKGLRAEEQQAEDKEVLQLLEETRLAAEQANRAAEERQLAEILRQSRETAEAAERARAAEQARPAAKGLRVEKHQAEDKEVLQLLEETRLAAEQANRAAEEKQLAEILRQSRETAAAERARAAEQARPVAPAAGGRQLSEEEQIARLLKDEEDKLTVELAAVQVQSIFAAAAEDKRRREEVAAKQRETFARQQAGAARRELPGTGAARAHNGAQPAAVAPTMTPALLLADQRREEQRRAHLALAERAAQAARAEQEAELTEDELAAAIAFSLGQEPEAKPGTGLSKKPK